MKRRMTFAEERSVVMETLDLVCRFLKEHNNHIAVRELREMGAFWILRQKEQDRATSSQSLKQESALRQAPQVAEIKNEQGSETYKQKALI